MNAQELVAARLIGSLFVERGLVSESQIRLALEIQEETDQQLGEILVERFGVSRAELAVVVAEQWQDAGRPAGPVLESALSADWRRIGDIFVSRGFVTEEELQSALDRQSQTGERLGEALVSLGVITKFELAGALGEQMSSLGESSVGPEQPKAEVVQLPTRAPVEEQVQESEPEPEPELEAQAEPELSVVPDLVDEPEPEDVEEDEAQATLEPVHEVIESDVGGARGSPAEADTRRRPRTARSARPGRRPHVLVRCLRPDGDGLPPRAGAARAARGGRAHRTGRIRRACHPPARSLAAAAGRADVRDRRAELGGGVRTDDVQLRRLTDAARSLHSGRGPLAQLVEQGTFNPKVAGSSPARPIGEADGAQADLRGEAQVLIAPARSDAAAASSRRRRATRTPSRPPRRAG